MEKIKYDPKQDGKTHINIYSKAKTVLGRSLSNFAFRRFCHPRYGVFCSMEGLYYYVSTGCKVESLRRLSGLAAKKEGKKHPRVEIKDFELIMREGIQACYMNDDKIREYIINQTIENDNKVLPFVHYYEYGGQVVVPEGNDWMCAEWETVRSRVLEQAGGEVVKNGEDVVVHFSEY